MAASDTVSGVTGAIGGVASMIPGYGTLIGGAISGIGSLASGLMKNSEAKQQAKRAEELRRQSSGLQKMPMRSEYLKSLKMNEMAALYGLPELNKYEQRIDEQVANNARSILESSPDGGTALNAINATLNKAYQAKNDLFMKDALLKEQKMGKVADTVWNTGDKQMDLVGLQRADKRDLNTAAGNLENAATANKIGSIDQILSTVGAFGNTIGKIGMNNAGNGNVQPITLNDGTTVSAETIAAIMAAMKNNGGSVTPYNFQ